MSEERQLKPTQPAEVSYSDLVYREERATYDVQAAQAVIEAERQQRAERCAQRIAALLEAERCQIVAVPQITADGRIVAAVQIVAQ